MDTLRKIFPLSWRFTGAVDKLVIGVLIYLAIAIAGEMVGGILGLLSLFSFLKLLIIPTLCRLIDLYVLGGIVILFLVHFNVLKD